METAGYIIVGSICERITFWGIPALRAVRRRASSIRSSAAGCGAAAGCRSSARRWTWATATWISPARPSCTPSAASARWRSPSSSVRASASTDKDGKPRAFPAHNIVFVVTGTFILLFGWMGFNPGSTLGATDLRIGVIAINTNLAAVAGSATAMLVLVLHVRQARHLDGAATACSPAWWRSPRPARSSARTRPSSSASSPASSSASACCSTSACSRSTIRAARSPCTATAAGSAPSRSASSPTARTAPAGTASARPRISARPARASPACSTATPRSSCCSSAAPRSAPSTRSRFTFVVFKIVNAVRPLRVSKEVELEGLDVPEFGMLAYPESGDEVSAAV